MLTSNSASILNLTRGLLGIPADSISSQIALGAETKALDGLGDVVARKLALEGYQVVREFGPRIGDPHAHYTRKFPLEAADADKLEVRVLPCPKAGSRNT
jgi:hypothetical protein